jgi:acyl-CoA thioesterase
MRAADLAQRCADTMLAKDKATEFLGLQLVSVEAGRAEMRMEVRPFMLNGHGICHGGFIFMLTDAAFAYASNTYDQVAVAQHCSITFLRVAREGMHLTAIAQERVRAGRSGIYDVTVVDENADMIAEFRGLSRTTKGTILDSKESHRG